MKATSIKHYRSAKLEFTNCADKFNVTIINGKRLDWFSFHDRIN